MKTEITDNQLFFKNMSFVKTSLVAILATFFVVSAFANPENQQNSVIELHSEMKSEKGIKHGEEVAEHGEVQKKSGKFDPGKMIMDHIVDAHDWHLWGEGHNSVSIPLPVIIYTKSKGITFFSSSRFEHGHAAYVGFELNQKGHIVWEDKTNLETVYDISLSKNVVAMLIAVY